MSAKNLCGGRKKDGGMCQLPAGFGTVHYGKGKCCFHGGGYSGKGAAKLLEIVAADPTLNQMAAAYLEDPELLSARRELAVLKARFTLIETREDDSDVHLLTKLGSTISKISQRIQDMEIGRHHYIHISVAANLVKAFTVIGQEYITDLDQRARFVEAIEESIRKDLRRTSSRAIAARALVPGTNLELEVDGYNE